MTQSVSQDKDDAARTHAVSSFTVRNATRSIIGTAGLLGLAAQWLLRDGPQGVGWLLWIALFGAAAFLVVRQGHFAWQRDTALTGALAVCAAAIMAVRASEALHALSMVMLITAASLPMLRARSYRFVSTSVAARLFGLALVPAHAIGGVFPLITSGAGSIFPARLTRTPVTVAARGALLAVPPLVVFGALFVSADPLFERYVQNLVTFVSEDVLGRVVLALVFAWIAAGLLRGLLPRRSALEMLPPMPALPSGEVIVALGAVTALFTAFVAVQSRWLFDGAAAVQATTGLTVADYARRGFFELVVASALTLPLLVVADAAVKPASRGARRALRVLSVSIVVLVLVIMASALDRMALYTERFGLTELRLYATAFIGWLGVVFAWFVITTLRGRRRRFSAGPVVAGFVGVLALSALNPDAVIARVNLARTHSGTSLDAGYLTLLSADAAPVLLRNLDRIPNDARCAIVKRLLSYNAEPEPAWQSTNYSVLRARSLVASNAAAIRRSAGAPCTP